MSARHVLSIPFQAVFFPQSIEGLYFKAVGYDGSDRNNGPMNPNATFWLASCSKLIGTVAALQCVERGQFRLDQPVDTILPELANATKFSVSEDDEALATMPAENAITLRHLLCHTSGLAYDMFVPKLGAWRASRGESPLGLSGEVVRAHTVPLLFEPGQGWAYGGGIDWAGELVRRLNNMTLEEYLHEHVFKPLGIESITFRLEEHPIARERLAKTSERTQNGTLAEAQRPWPNNVPEDCAGAGLYSSVADYMSILSDLIRDRPVLLKRETVDQMFKPQLAPESSALHSLLASTDVISTTTCSAETMETAVNVGLGGLYIGADTAVFKQGTLLWGGMPNLTWLMNREHGIAAMYASQVLPPGDAASSEMAKAFMSQVWEMKQDYS
ncbi:Beta-lactamase/transpeptidase-like protein, partial [Metarhizium hybridum]